MNKPPIKKRVLRAISGAVAGAALAAGVLVAPGIVEQQVRHEDQGSDQAISWIINRLWRA